MSTLRDELDRAIRTRRLTQRAAALYIGISESLVSKILRGKSGPLSSETLEKLSSFTGSELESPRPFASRVMLVTLERLDPSLAIVTKALERLRHQGVALVRREEAGPRDLDGERKVLAALSAPEARVADAALDEEILMAAVELKAAAASGCPTLVLMNESLLVCDAARSLQERAGERIELLTFRDAAELRRLLIERVAEWTVA